MNTHYFPHDVATTQDPKISQLLMEVGHAGYGIFWRLVEDLYLNKNSMPLNTEVLAYRYHEDPELIEKVIRSYGLFMVDEKFFSSPSVQRRIGIIEEKTTKGRKAAEARWKGSDTKYPSSTKKFTEKGSSLNEQRKQKKQSLWDETVKERGGQNV